MPRSGHSAWLVLCGISSSGNSSRARLLRQQALQQLQGGIAVGRQSRTALEASDCAARVRPHHAVWCATFEAALVQGRLQRRQLLA